MRGKDFGCCVGVFSQRITPACAGKSLFMDIRSEYTRDHPRLCGEKLLYFSITALSSGSPPLVRGKAGEEEHIIATVGITPACAGKSYPIVGVGRIGRITPACAGKRIFQTLYRDEFKDHPRLCGEKPAMKSTLSRRLGSPPLVRGKESFRFPYTEGLGITPACAGKSQIDRRWTTCSGDHPRLCGEKKGFCISFVSGEGSPPLVRGKGRSVKNVVPRQRITPACAGKRKFFFNCPLPWQDHPRLCGEKIIATVV